MTENKQSIIDKAEGTILHTYGRYSVVLDRGEGVYLYDTDGKKYLDFAAGIAVQALGYHYPGYDEALKIQIDKLTHTSNLYYNEPAAEAAGKIIKFSGMSKVFFTNSGTEAIEGAIKAARKYAYVKGRKGGTIIAMNNSFHGRSIGALSVTGNEHYQEPFRPLMGGVRFADFNDLDSVAAQFDDSVCAVIMETIQGEGGIYPATEEFLKGVKKLCEEHDALMILDEIQCGMGRSGYPFAWMEYGVEPDIMTCAKALGCGVPVGAFLIGGKAAEHTLEPGDHGTTYGGNPFACAAVSKVLDIFVQDDIVGHVCEVAPYLTETLDGFVEKYAFLTQRRGKGFMQGIEACGVSAGDIVLAALEEGLIVITASNNVVRFVPPLVITRDDVDEMAEKFGKALEGFAS